MNDKQVLIQCLKELNLNILASDVKTQTNWSVIYTYAKVAIIKALKLNRMDIIDRLELMGMIY